MQYLVVEDGAGWLIRDDEDIVAAAQSLEDALATAKILAHAVKASGGVASVCVQDTAGELVVYNLDSA